MIQIPTSNPGKGFSLAKTASTNDPYQNYEKSVVNGDAIWEALTTEAGRQALGAQIN